VPVAIKCGIRLQVVRILHAQGVDFSSVNILDYPAIREGVKKFSDWPTIPQVYVNGEFIGGCDIVTQQHKSGELAQLFKDAGLLSAEPPKSATDSA
jgi:monothiol glutaredoxin